jgi:hypothetical protein
MINKIKFPFTNLNEWIEKGFSIEEAKALTYIDLDFDEFDSAMKVRDKIKNKLSFEDLVTLYKKVIKHTEKEGIETNGDFKWWFIDHYIDQGIEWKEKGYQIKDMIVKY